MQTPSFLEDHISQIPAIQLLVNLGYKYLTPEEAMQEKGLMQVSLTGKIRVKIN